MIKKEWHFMDKAKQRKQTPVYTGVLMYFPDAIKEIAQCSYAGDELDALTRHLMECGTVDSDGVRHSAKVAWRALANLQKEIENEGSN